MVGTASSVDRYSTWEMDAMIAAIDPPFSFLKDTFFTTEKQFTTQVIEHDIKEHGRTVAPFVSPLSQGKPTRRSGYRTFQIRPAYIKLSDTVRPQDGMTRLAGEPYGGQFTVQQRIDALVAEQIATHMSMIDNRLEVMARDILINGKLTIITDNYPTAIVDFERNPNNTHTVGTTWDQTNATPLADIQAHALTINLNSRGAVVTDLVMAGSIFDLMARNQSVRDLLSKLLNLSPGTSGIEVGPRSGSREAQFRGRLSGAYNLWTYDGYFENDTGLQVPLMPTNKVLFVCNGGINGSGPGGIGGKRLQGAIQDLDAQMQAKRVFIKAKNEWDPSGVTVLTQSAPMLAVDRPNCSGILQVL